MTDTNELRAAAERLSNEAYNGVEHAEMYEQPLQRARDAMLLARAYLEGREKLADDREKLVQCLNDLVSSGELSTKLVMRIDNVIADTVGSDKL